MTVPFTECRVGRVVSFKGQEGLFTILRRTPPTIVAIDKIVPAEGGLVRLSGMPGTATPVELFPTSYRDWTPSELQAGTRRL